MIHFNPRSEQIMQSILPISAIVPTRDRALSLSKTFNSLAAQSALPSEIIVVDASTTNETEELCRSVSQRFSIKIVYLKAVETGAATQRNQGLTLATQSTTWFFDDDILLEPYCVSRLWSALESDPQLGGVSAMIMNQRYQPPGIVSRTLFRLLNGRAEATFAGRVIGPAINLLPEDNNSLPEVVAVDWLNTTCTLYRREALPAPPFDPVFVDYSLLEDLALSLRVGKKWRLANARTARIFHDSQPGAHKADVSALAAMELVNRHYVMTEILERCRVLDHLRLFIWEVFQLSSCALRAQSRKQVWAKCRGKLNGLGQIYGKFARPQSLSEPGLPQSDAKIRNRMQNS